MQEQSNFTSLSALYRCVAYVWHSQTSKKDGSPCWSSGGFSESCRNKRRDNLFQKNLKVQHEDINPLIV